MGVVAKYLASAFLITPVMTFAQGIWTEGDLDCGLWVKARTANNAEYLESYLLGLMNGLVVGSGQEFWRAGGSKVSRDSVYLWMDNYCRTNPLSHVITGAHVLFRERAPSRATPEKRK